MTSGKAFFHIGNTKGHLTLVAAIPTRFGRGKARMWAFCDCGGEMLVTYERWDSEKNLHCGCSHNPEKWASLQTHGLSKSKEYRVWAAMWSRCTNKKVAGYSLYGGRGIKVDPAWADFGTFLRDMGPRPSDDHSLDRLDVNGPYAPGNVRWALAHEQAANKRNNRMLTAHGQTLPLAVWARQLGVSQGCLYQRLKRATPEQALVPAGQYKRPYEIKRAHKSKFLTYRGVTLNCTEWGERLGISGANISRRLRRGYTVEQALQVGPYKQFWRRREGLDSKRRKK